jgi:type IV pilus assembly protein PilB
MEIIHFSLPFEGGFEAVSSLSEELRLQNVNVLALDIYKSGEKRILQILVDKPALTETILSGRNIPFEKHTVTAVRSSGSTEEISRLAAVLSRSSLNYSHCYSFSLLKKNPVVVFQPEGIEKAREKLRPEVIDILPDMELIKEVLQGRPSKAEDKARENAGPPPLRVYDVEQVVVDFRGSDLKLSDVVSELFKNNISIHGCSQNKTADESSVSLLVGNSFLTEEILWKLGLPYKLVPSLAVTTSDDAGFFSRFAKLLEKCGVVPENGYTISGNPEESIIVLKFLDPGTAVSILADERISLLSAGELFEAEAPEAGGTTPLKTAPAAGQAESPERESEMEKRARKMGVAFTNLSKMELDRESVIAVPENISRRHKLVCIEKTESRCILAMADPIDIFAIDEVRMITGCEIQPTLAEPADIDKALDRYYSWKDTVLKEFDPGAIEVTLEKQMGEEEEDVVIDQPIIMAANKIITEAVERKASDIHIEPYENDLVIRYRIDGILYEAMVLPKGVTPALISRIKIMSNLRIDEKRIPQDGRIHMKIANRELDIRVSTVPAMDGESVVMRLLDRSRMKLSLTDMGFDPKDLERYNQVIARPNGILLVTGPTGSGKSTTLYATLNVLNDPTRKIVTVEDPVEYKLKGVIQIQTHATVGLTFATALRAFLRQDPDVMMVGEIRDRETATIAIESALTGHLVLSTLHTNDSVGAITRMVDMGVEPFLISSTVAGILAQRLVRTICPKCKESAPRYPELMKIFREHGFPEDGVQLARGRGCRACDNLGYKGRVGIYELLTVTDGFRELIVGHASASKLTEQARADGMKMLYEDGLAKVARGLTTYEELCRVTVE